MYCFINVLSEATSLNEAMFFSEARGNPLGERSEPQEKNIAERKITAE